MDETNKYFVWFLVFLVIVFGLLYCFDKGIEYNTNMKFIESGYEQVDGNWMKK